MRERWWRAWTANTPCHGHREHVPSHPPPPPLMCAEERDDKKADLLTVSHGKIYNLSRSRIDSGFSIERGACWGFPNVCAARVWIHLGDRKRYDRCERVISLLRSGKGSCREMLLLHAAAPEPHPGGSWWWSTVVHVCLLTFWLRRSMSKMPQIH